jgi:hypothetical protein
VGLARLGGASRLHISRVALIREQGEKGNQDNVQPSHAISNPFVPEKLQLSLADYVQIRCLGAVLPATQRMRGSLRSMPPTVTLPTRDAVEKVPPEMWLEL